MEDQALQFIRDGNVEGTKKLIRQHPELSQYRNLSGRTLLHFAAAKGKTDIVRCLVEAGLPLNVTDPSGECPLSAMVRHNEAETVRWMLDKGADPRISQWPMIDAVSNGNLEMVKLLIEHGAEYDFTFGDPPRTPLSQAMDYGHQEVADFLRSLSAKMPAASAEVASATDEPVEARVAVEPKDLFAIADLILEGDFAAIERLLAEKPELLHARSFDMGETWLHYAAGDGKFDLVRFFFERGIPMNTLNNSGECPLSAVASEGDMANVEWMLANGADPKLCNAPMISAVSKGDLTMVQRFLELGADYNFTFGRPPRTPLSQAIDFGHHELADYLRSLGAAMPTEVEAADEGEEDDEGLEAFDLHEEIKEYFAYHLERPPLRMGLQEIVPGKVNISVWTIDPENDEDPKVIFTTGMSEKPLTVPKGYEEFAYAELAMYLPPDWPVQPDLSDTSKSWPWIWLRKLAHYAHEQNTWYGEWTTSFANGEPPEPLDASTKFAGFLLATNMGGLQGFPSDDGRFVNIINVVPVFPEELGIAKDEDGTVKLLKLFEKHDIAASLRPNRRNVGLDSGGSLGGLFRRKKT